MKKTSDSFFNCVMFFIFTILTIIAVLWGFGLLAIQNENSTIESIRQAFDENDIQIQIVLYGNYEAKESLLQSYELNSNALVALCIYPKPLDLDNKEIRNSFESAIERVELTEEQQIQIIRLNEYLFTKELLLSPNLTAEALVAICENPEPLNLKNKEVQDWFKAAIERTGLTKEQKSRIVNSKIQGMFLY